MPINNSNDTTSSGGVQLNLTNTLEDTLFNTSYTVSYDYTPDVGQVRQQALNPYYSSVEPAPCNQQLAINANSIRYYEEPLNVILTKLIIRIEQLEADNKRLKLAYEEMLDDVLKEQT